jgi:hypothetical protein
MLADRVDELRARAGPDRRQVLGAYLSALATSPNPQSTLRWMQTPSFALVEDVVDGRLGITHEASDERQGTGSEKSAIAYLRAALVAHGALPARDETGGRSHAGFPHCPTAPTARRSPRLRPGRSPASSPP